MASVWVLCGPLVALHPLPAPATGQSAVPFDISQVPSPSLETFEEGVQNQLTQVRQAVEELFAGGKATEMEQGNALGQLGSLYLLYDFVDAAEVCLVPAQRLDPENFLWPYYLAALYTLEGDLDAARDALARAVAIDPRSVPTWLRQGNVLLDAGEIDLAERSFLEVEKLDPGNSAARLGRGQVAFRRGEYETAVEQLEAALEEQPEGSVAHYFLAMSFRRLGDMQAARKHLELNESEPALFFDEPITRLRAFNVSREALFTLGIEAMRRGDPERALVAFQRTLEAEPGDPETHYNLGIAFLEMGDEEQAEVHMRQAIELRPGYRNAHFNLAILLSMNGQEEEAVRHFERVAEIDPDDLKAKVQLAEALVRVDDRDRAFAILQEALDIDPAMVEARLTLATLQGATGQIEAAAENLQRILDLAPGAVEARSEAHLTLATLDPALPKEQVVEHLRAAVELAADLVEAHRLLALELAQQGDFAAAAEHFSRVSELEPGDPHVYFGHAMALIFAGSYEQARTELEASLAVLPDSIPLTHLLARLLATCPDADVRDGERALELSLSVAMKELTMEHAQTLAMAYAELGQFEEAIRWQQRVVSEETKTPAGASAASQRLLELYQQGQPIRAPWLDS